MRAGFKFVAADLTSWDHDFSYFDAVRSGEWVTVDEDRIVVTNLDPCPSREGDGLCVAKTVAGASSGGQPASTAVGLVVEFDEDDVLGEDEHKIRVRRFRVTGVFDPVWLIRLGLCQDLQGADLRNADLEGAKLHGANLEGARLDGANLEGAVLAGANLRWADLRWADLRGAVLRGADLRGAELHGARLYEADLRGTGLREEDLEGAKL